MQRQTYKGTEHRRSYHRTARAQKGDLRIVCVSVLSLIFEPIELLYMCSYSVSSATDAKSFRSKHS
jgi:hypothetical protein